MHGLVPLDRTGAVVRPAIIWCDQRSTEEVAEIYRVIGREEVGRITLNPVFTGFMIASLLWMKRHEPESYQRIATVMLPKDYLRYRLTGTVGTDVTDASSTLAFDTTRRQWADGLLEALGVPISIFPSCALPTEQVGVVSAAAAGDTGLAEGTPVMSGGSDQPMQAIGSGLTEPGVLSITTGTGGQLFSLCERPLLNPLLNTHTFCHVIPGCWYVMAATLSAGMSLSWFARAVAREEDLAALTAEAAAVPPGSEGAIFLPYLAGERTPHLDPEASGLFYGLTLKHTRAHMTRAILEGVAYSYRDCLETLLSFGVPVHRIVGAGGGARNPLWLQIQADVLGRPIAATTAPEQASLGAAITAGIGAGMYADYRQACAALIRQENRVVEPDPSHAEVYQARYGRYRELYARIRGPDRAHGQGESIPAGAVSHRIPGKVIGADAAPGNAGRSKR
jgi:xylulokinase